MNGPFIYWDRQSMQNQELILLFFDLLASGLENRMNYPIILPFAPTWKALQKYAGGQGRKKVFIVPLKEMKGTPQKLLVFGWCPLLVQGRK